MENMGTIAKVTSTLAPVLHTLSVVIPQLRPVSVAVTVIDTLIQQLGFAEDGQTVESVGQDILDAYHADIKPTDYTTYDEYMQAIRDFKLENPDREMGEYLFAEKFASGLSVQTWGLEEKFGDEMSSLILAILKDAQNLEQGEGYFTPERIDSWITDVSSLADVAKYFGNELGIDEKNKVEQELVAIEKEQHPDKSLADIYKELDNIKDKIVVD